MRFGMIAAAAAMLCAGQASADTYSVTGGLFRDVNYLPFSQYALFNRNLGTLKSVSFLATLDLEDGGYSSGYDANGQRVSVIHTGTINGAPSITFGSVYIPIILDSRTVSTTTAPNDTYATLYWTGRGSALITTGLDYFTCQGVCYAYSPEVRQVTDAVLGVPTVTTTAPPRSGGYFSTLGFGGTYNYRITYEYDTAGAVPEPAAWLLMIVGFGIVGSAVRRRKPIVGVAKLVRWPSGGATVWKTYAPPCPVTGRPA